MDVVFRERGCSSKQAFALEQLNALPKSLIAETRLAHDKNATSAKLRLVILGSWFLLREIEVAAAEAWHLTVDNDKQICTWMLSATKTDPRAIGTSRSHGCCCQQGRTIICPYHTARDHLQCIQSLHGQEYTAGQQAFPLFPRGIFSEAPQDKSTAFLTKPEVISYIEHVAQLIGEAIEYITPQGKRKRRFGGHVMRVMGAQLLARADVELNVIKLVGRWGSSAIERYVQEAPLHLQQHLSSKVVIGQDVTQQQAKTAKTHHSEHMSSLALQLKELHKRIEAQENKTMPFIVNVKEDKMHMCRTDESELPPLYWRTKCGWSYGLTEFRRTTAVPTKNKCIKCFRTQP